MRNVWIIQARLYPNGVAIASLNNSGSFASSHAQIAKLDTFDQFTPEQVERLVKIPGENNQVGWIIEDPDVHAFYAKLLEKYAKVLKKDDLDVLTELVEKGKQNEADIPF